MFKALDENNNMSLINIQKNPKNILSIEKERD